MNDKELIDILVNKFKANDPSGISWKFLNKSFYINVPEENNTFQLTFDELKDTISDEEGNNIISWVKDNCKKLEDKEN